MTHFCVGTDELSRNTEHVSVFRVPSMYFCLLSNILLLSFFLLLFPLA